jgi:hypothetical protein
MDLAVRSKQLHQLKQRDSELGELGYQNSYIWTHTF